MMEKGRITRGVIHNPATGEMFYAEKGKGAYLNKKRIRVSGISRMDKALLATGFACIRSGLKKNNLPLFNTIIQKVQGIRRLGAASLDIAYVASGAFEGFWEMNLSPWDVAAGCILVEEAGGRVTDFKLGGDYIFKGKILASNGLIHNKLLNLIKKEGFV